MKKLMKKKVSMFGKEVSVFLVALVCVGLVSAALLGFYGVITGMAIVSQSVTIDGEKYPNTIEGEWNGDLVAGDSVTDCGDGTGYNLKNNANVEAPVDLEITCDDTDGGTQAGYGVDEACEGITTEVYGVLELTSKDPSTWLPTTNRKATLLYTLVGNEFGYELEATGLDASTEYSLIYYADKQDRFVDWGGDNPGALIFKATSDSDGILVVNKNSIELSMNLPHQDDWNGGVDACAVYSIAPDTFEHCSGAKIWLVPSADYGETEKKLTAWNPLSYLFETDLIVYSDTTDGTITLPAGGGVNFCVDNDFALNLVEDDYTIEVTVEPTA